MPTLEAEMKEIAAYAIKAAKDRYKKDLDFSEQSVTILDNILTKISWGFSGPAEEGGDGGLANNQALVWGSFLGEYMISRWGGKWIQRDTERLVSINNILFFPINFVFQKITNHPEYNVEDYLLEIRKIIYSSVINPEDALFEPRNIERFKQQITAEKARKPLSINRRSIYILAGILGAIVIFAVSIVGFAKIKSDGLSAIFLPRRTPSTSTPSQIIPTATPRSTGTLVPTATPLPTYTALPSNTPSPTYTPSLTYTRRPSPTATETPLPFTPTNTLRPTLPDTATSAPPTSTPKPPTIPPVVIESCEVNPSIVASNINQKITFIVRFSAPGYQFTANNDGPYSGQSGCSGVDDNGDSIAYCDAWSGELPDHTTVNVSITSTAGNCNTSYHSP